jgi:hypothetical protein
MSELKLQKKMQVVALEHPVAAAVPKVEGEASLRLRFRSGLRAGDNRNNANRLFDSQTVVRGRSIGYRERSGRTV